jgi:hypothetical protein
MIDPRSTRAYKLEKENRELKNIINRVGYILDSILIELEETGEAEQVVAKIETCVKELKGADKE